VFLSSLLGEQALLDTESIAYSAFTWLMGNTDLRTYNETTLQQRFAMACLHLSTNQDATWEEDDGWMTDSDECFWFGVDCKDGFLMNLNLTDNGLEGLVPDEITLLSDSLLELELSENDLVNENEQLAWIGELTNLSKYHAVHMYDVDSLRHGSTSQNAIWFIIRNARC
jgi:hypothetical protein